MPIFHDTVAPFQDDLLVVDQPDVELVCRELTALGVQPRQQPPLTALALVPVQLVGLGPAADRILAKRPDLRVSARSGERRGGRPAPAGGEPEQAPAALDILLLWLRERFTAAYHGWTPVMGKDRLLRAVHGLPYIKGGLGDPTPLTAPLEIPPGGNVAGPRVGIIDTRLFPHPDLLGRFIGDPATDLGTPPPATAGHATFIAGLIVRRAPQAQLVTRAVLDIHGTAVSSLAVADRLVSFLDAGVSVLNMSWGCFTRDGLPPLVLSRAVRRLAGSMVLVAAAGNYGRVDEADPVGVHPTSPMWPAALPDVVAVGAHPDDDPLASDFFSPDVPWVDLLAPGVASSTFLPGEVRLVHLDPAGEPVEVDGRTGVDDFGAGFASWGGTSFAAAAVSGAVAAMVHTDGVDPWTAVDRLRHGSGPADIRSHPLAPLPPLPRDDR